MITDVNETPTNLVVSGGAVLEGAANGTVVASLSGVDQDAGEAFSFLLLDNAGGRFAIRGDKILVADAFKLDYEQARSHQVLVRITDKNGAGHDEVLTLTVADVRNESVAGSSTHDQIFGGTGNDRMSGGAGNDVLTAGAGKDVLIGGTGNDRLVGGTGQDTLTGGSGKDRFVFGQKDTSASKKSADYITDFSGRSGDRIDLSAIDADVRKKGNQKFSFIGTEEFTKAGPVRYEKTKKETYVYLNTDSDKSAEAVIKLKGSIDLQKGWFVL
jgi:Ca2+-binding RTX toxin-like protein